MNPLSIILVIVAIAIAAAGRVLSRRQGEAARRLQQTLEAGAQEEPQSDEARLAAEWDEEDARMEADVTRLLNMVSGVFKGAAIGFLAAAVILFFLLR